MIDLVRVKSSDGGPGTHFDAFKIGRDERRNEAYLDFVRALPCWLCGRAAPSEAHHFPHKKMGGGGAWSDYLTVPLCRECHGRAHGDPALSRDLRHGILATTHLALARGVR